MPTQVWKCDFCNMFFNTEVNASSHERDCCLNIKNRACPSCANYENDCCNALNQVRFEILKPYFEDKEHNCPLWKGGRCDV